MEEEGEAGGGRRGGRWKKKGRQVKEEGGKWRKKWWQVNEEVGTGEGRMGVGGRRIGERSGGRWMKN